MEVYLLDAGGAGLYYIFIGLAIIFMLLAVLAEAGIMILMKYTIPFKKAFIDSLIINVISLAAGFILLELFDTPDFSTIQTLAIFYIITVIIEAIGLYLLNKQKPVQKTILVTIAMNMVTYIILYLFYGSNW